ncbi:antitoxin [bacterium]|nr:antitoxin [bacterium]
MQNKLTLRLEEELINQAKEYAASEGKSVSKIVADYFSLLVQQSKKTDSKLPPITQSLVGILSSPVDESDYRDYLEEKYL